MRHVGIFPTFIMNDRRTLPDEVYTLLGNPAVFSSRNEGELNQLAGSGLSDLKSISAMKHLEKRQCIVVGSITANYLVFLEVKPPRRRSRGRRDKETCILVCADWGYDIRKCGVSPKMPSRQEIY